MIQKLIEKLNKKRLKERISSAIVMVALIVSISGVVGAVSGIVVSNCYNYALKNYGFSQGDIGKMMITFADTRSYLRAAIGYQDENLVNSCAENYEKKKESCQQYTKEVKNTVSSSDEEKIYSSITEKLTEYYEICDAVLEKGKNTQDIDARHEAQQMAQDQVAPIYEEIYQDILQLLRLLHLQFLQPAGSAECLHRILLILWISWVLVLIHLQRGISPANSRR